VTGGQRAMIHARAAGVTWTPPVRDHPGGGCPTSGVQSAWRGHHDRSSVGAGLGIHGDVTVALCESDLGT